MMMRRGLVVLVVSLGSTLCFGAGPPRVLTWADTLQGSADLPLRWPTAVAAASNEELAIVDAYDPRLLRFRKVGVSWQVSDVISLAGHAADLVYDGSAYVASLRTVKELVAFAGDPLEERRINLPPNVVPGSLAVSAAGGYLLFDLRGQRVLRLNRNGQVQQQVAVGAHVTALVEESSGGFLAAVADRGQVRRYNANWRATETWDLPGAAPVPAWPVGLAVDTTGSTYVVDRHSGRILVLARRGSVAGIGANQGWEPGLLLFPSGIAILPNGLLVVADEGGGRAQLFRRSDRGSTP